MLPEADSAQAQRLISDIAVQGDQLIVLDIAMAEVANAIWKQVHRRLVPLDDGRRFLTALMSAPVQVRACRPLLPLAFEIAAEYDRSIYDALFVALARNAGTTGVTADEPLHNVVNADFPEVVLLRDW